MPLVNTKEMFKKAYEGGYAIGAFNVNNMEIVQGITEACEELKAPVILQVSAGARKYANHTYLVKLVEAAVKECPDIPIALHLDHGASYDICKSCIDGGFTSVMFDGSSLPYEENIEVASRVAEYAHKYGVTVEAELGKIGTTDFVEIDVDEELYTDPEEAKRFCELTGVDSLAISVGTAHGVYTVRQPKVDYARLEAINALTDTPLVLHGGSGVPSEMVVRAAQLPQGGVSKVNIATDLELAMLAVVGREGHMTEAELNACTPEQIEKSREAVRELVELKITDYLLSRDKA